MSQEAGELARHKAGFFGRLLLRFLLANPKKDELGKYIKEQVLSQKGEIRRILVTIIAFSRAQIGSQIEGHDRGLQVL